MKAFSYITDNSGKLGVAVSGGSDSMALLVLAADFGRTAGVTVSAATVDHGLRPEAAGEAKAVARECGRLGVAHDTLKWRRKAERPVSQAEARRARHVLLAQWAARREISMLALGHTRDDRIETFLMRARQGSGWHGLAGPMPNGYSPVWPEGAGLGLARPLLAFGREELREELRARGVAWIEDPSNESGRFERVRMRRLLKRMNGQSGAKALRVMDRLMEMRAAVTAEAASLLRRLSTGQDGRAAIPLMARETVGEEAWLRFLEAMVMAAGGAVAAPRRDALERLAARIAAREPALARGVTLAGAAVHLRDGAVLTFAQAPPRRGTAPAKGAAWDRADALLTAPDLRMLSV
jgi:tRNA(Ile)-lysidine synthase